MIEAPAIGEAPGRADSLLEKQDESVLTMLRAGAQLVKPTIRPEEAEGVVAAPFDPPSPAGIAEGMTRRQKISTNIPAKIHGKPN